LKCQYTQEDFNQENTSSEVAKSRTKKKRQLKHSLYQENQSSRIIKPEEASESKEEETEIESDFVSLENWGFLNSTYYDSDQDTDNFYEENIFNFDVDEPDKDHDFFFDEIKEFPYELNSPHSS
ncbi:3998_t:CDS:2, partial [Dentiscutata heterogama]